MLHTSARVAALALTALGFLLGGAGDAHAGEKMAAGAFAITRHSSPNAGQVLAGGAVILNTTIGDVGTETASGGAFINSKGLQRVMAQPGSVVSITAATKSTGTLDLSWNAPGLDGSVASAVGFYRIDYSSEPAHVFSPTTYQLQFATSVAPGDAQRISLTGLEVNTTYFTKIYLSGPEKFFAEESIRSDESTLANVPVSAVLVTVGSATVTLTWGAPVGATEGFQADASSTNFGAATPGGLTLSSSTRNGLVTSLVIPGLAPNTTYFLKVASLNWQGDRNYVVVIPVQTIASAAPLPIVFLISVPSALNRTLSFSWTNQAYDNPAGVLVLQSTNATTSQVSDGLGPFTPGQVLGDGSIVKSTSAAASLSDSALALDSTYYYHFFSQATGLLYSVDVTTSVFLDLAPMAVANLSSTRSLDKTQVTLNWNTVISNLDGSLFTSSTTPLGVELQRYEIGRATSVLNANFVAITTVSVSSLTYTDTALNPALTYVYRVRSLDSFNKTEPALAVDSSGDSYIFTSDNVTHMHVPQSSQRDLDGATNSYGANIVIRAVEEAGDAAQKIYRSVLFEARKSPDNTVVNRFEFSRPEITVAMHYDVVNGQVVVSGAAPASGPATAGGIPAAAASQTLGIYWNNGSKFVKLFGKVDTLQQVVAVQGINGGEYQIRGVLRDQGLNFDVTQLSNKVITPNGDGRNDNAVFMLDNPRDAGFSGKIFDKNGAFIADMTPGVLANSLKWDATGGGRVVPGGVYIYQIRGESKVFSGTLIVIR